MGFAEYTTLSQKEILEKLKAKENGLSNDEAKTRLESVGPNTLDLKKTGWVDILIRQLKSPFIYLLIAAASVYLFIGEPIDSLLIFLFVFIDIILGFYQEYRSNNTLNLLKKFIVAKSTVLRDGKKKIIDSYELVPGDVVLLAAGDKIQADVRFLETEGMSIDESVLTGEAEPAFKKPQALKKKVKEFYLAKNIGFSGTTILTGSAKALVIATGKETAFGKIAKLSSIKEVPGSYEKGIAKLSNFILKLILVTSLFVFAVNIVIKGNNFRPLEFAIFSIALAISVIPETLPVVTIFSLSKGALKLARKKVVVKKLSAIEDLGSIEVLCCDKTGTLTQNQMKLSQIQPNNLKDFVIWGFLALEDPKNESFLNPFAKAIFESLTFSEKISLKNFLKIKEIPFDPLRRRVSSYVCQKDYSQGFVLSAGAPEEILRLCSHIKDKEKILLWLKKEGRAGKRVLGIARKKVPPRASIEIAREEHNMDFLGLCSFEDPLKPTAKEALAKAKKLGVSIKIITGDAPEVAGKVAEEVGIIKNINDVISGPEIYALNEQEFSEAVEKYSVFARVSPDQKYEIIQKLAKKHEVGFLGEGVNDAPALNAANVGLVVEGASDIAKDSSDIVLLQPSLNVIVDGIEEGRSLLGNTTKYIKATLASNFGNFFAVASASLLVNYPPMLPVQILLLDLLSDFPMITIATDNIDTNEVARPKSYSLKEIAVSSTVLGAVSTVFDFIFFVIFSRISPAVLQTNWFIASVLTELAIIFSLRTKGLFFKTRRPSKTLLFFSVLAFFTTIILPTSEIGETWFKFTHPSIATLAVIIGLTGCYFVTTEAVKLLYYKLVPHFDNSLG